MCSQLWGFYLEMFTTVFSVTAMTRHIELLSHAELRVEETIQSRNSELRESSGLDQIDPDQLQSCSVKICLLIMLKY